MEKSLLFKTYSHSVAKFLSAINGVKAVYLYFFLIVIFHNNFIHSFNSLIYFSNFKASHVLYLWTNKLKIEFVFNDIIPDTMNSEVIEFVNPHMNDLSDKIMSLILKVFGPKSFRF